jgi:uncharacterized protein
MSTLTLSLPVTSILAALFALLMVPLSLNVSMRRIQLGGISLGDGDDETLRRRIRAHGNFIEYIPTGLIVIGLVELAGANRLQVAALAAAFFISRVLHALGMLYSQTPSLRAFSMLIQHTVFIVSAIWLLLIHVNVLSLK